MKKDDLLNSNYDGIQEYDNDLPKWWRVLFYITIIFAIVYSAYYFSGYGPTSAETLASELKAIEGSKKAIVVPVVDPNELATLVKDTTRISNGKAVYSTRCAACHGPDGQGLVGPSLTDEYWIHGGKLSDIRRTIEEGVLDKGMLAWKSMLSTDEIINVTAFIRSLHGTNPANPKTPQGERYLGNE